METLVLTSKMEETRNILKMQLRFVNDAFLMSSNDDAVLMCSISRTERNKLFTMYSHNGQTIGEWYEPIN